MNIEIGYLKGETCNRGGCIGIIDEYEKEGSCSCHINPPCSYCVNSSEYCPACEWDGREEQIEKENERAEVKYTPIKIKTYQDLDNTKIDYIVSGHTSFTQICEGVYPEGITKEDVFEKVKGTFGGRFDRFSGGHFKFIAYTD